MSYKVRLSTIVLTGEKVRERMWPQEGSVRTRKQLIQQGWRWPSASFACFCQQRDQYMLYSVRH